MPPLIRWENRQVITSQSPLISAQLEKTFMSADIAAASATLTVKNISGFAVGQYLWINPFGENGEIIATHASSAPSGNTITLAANTVFQHYTGEKVYRIEFDQVEISWSATVGGSKSVLATNSLQGDQQELPYLETTKTTGYYFGRFKASVAATFGNYSDGVQYGTFARSTVGYMIDRALKDLSISFSALVTLLDCYEWINDGLTLVKGKLKHWPEHYSYNTSIGVTSRGNNVVAMPTDIYDLETNKSLLAVRIGQGTKLTYLDPQTFEAQLRGVATSQVTTQQTAGGTTLAVNNTEDFADSGTVYVYIAGTKYGITYTGVTRSQTAGVLTGVPASGTGSISVTIAVDTHVWQNEEEGVPAYFTVRNSNIEYWPLADATQDNMNVFADYAKVVTMVDTDGDIIDQQRYDMIQAYLTWRVYCKAKQNGELVTGTMVSRRFVPNGFYSAFTERLADTIKTLPQNNKFPMKPTVNRMSKRPVQGTRSLQTINILDQ